MTALDWFVVLFVAVGLFMAWPIIRERRDDPANRFDDFDRDDDNDDSLDDLEREYRERLFGDNDDDSGDD